MGRWRWVGLSLAAAAAGLLSIQWLRPDGAGARTFTPAGERAAASAVERLAARPEEGDATQPDPRERLLEQIETARLGLLAAQAARPAASSTGGPAAPVASARSSAAGASSASIPAEWVAMGTLGAALAAAALWSRRAQGRRTAAPSAPGPPELEGRLRTLEESLLQVVKMVEEASVRPLVPEAAVPAPQAAASRVEQPSSAPPEPIAVERGPGCDPELLLPPPVVPATMDGRELGRIRGAVLKLASEGWTAERIARRLRLGSGDVTLILKTGHVRPKAGHEEMAESRR